MSDGLIKANNIVGSAIAVGHHSVAVVTHPNNALSPADSVDIAAELAQLRALLEKIGGPNKDDVKLRLDLAAKEAVKQAPDKAEIGGALSKAITYAKDANGFLEQMNKLSPTVVKVAGWLGEYGAPLLGLLK